MIIPKYKRSSSYAKTALLNGYLDLFKPVLTRDSLSQETRKIKIENKYDRRPDLMAYDLYGNPNVWWIFVHYNREKIKDPINDFKSGITIVVPKNYQPPGEY